MRMTTIKNVKAQKHTTTETAESEFLKHCKLKNLREETLKKFGIVLTEANLNAFALSRGITKSYNAMSQAEKVALRYNYVLKATANVQGDFARTSGSFANQVRILKEQWS